MPRYFFDVHDGQHIIDNDGTELQSTEEARIEAVVLAGNLLRDHPERFWDGEDWRVEVFDETRLLLFVLNFSATVAPATSQGRA